MSSYKGNTEDKNLPFIPKYFSQVKLLLWKRYHESTKDRWELIKLVLPALLFFALLILLYEGFTFFTSGGIERFLVPFAFWILIQRMVMQIMYEKSTRLQESMRMMGLLDVAYWTSYFISDGIIIGFLLSLLCSIMTVGGLFNGASFGTILGFFICFCLSAIPFSFFLCAFFDTPQTASQFTLVVLMGLYVLDIVFMNPSYLPIQNVKQSQIIMCLFPPMALQEASGSFLGSYDGISISSICGMMILDIFIYSILAWYFWQVWPSSVGVTKPFYFFLESGYWFPNYQHNRNKTKYHKAASVASSIDLDIEISLEMNATTTQQHIPIEEVNEELLGSATVEVNKLRKTFGNQVSVNDLSFKMYENQIFALLGHNGAGKTTTINMLTGMLRPDLSFEESNDTYIYGNSIHSEMDQIRYSLGVCPQHDVLFEKLTVHEHILFFAQLKGATYAAASEDATKLTNLFHLEQRLDHLGSELSGGQKRKLSVAIAVCGGSKFIVLDEPTAGMDPLARRELWDLLSKLRKGRTMLLTTHYMDEADILGDRVGIMSLGQMQCMGSTQFLKATYGAGYKLTFDKLEGMNADQLANLTSFVQNYVPEAKYFEEEGADSQAFYSLPFNTVSKFGALFTKLEEGIDHLYVENYGISITSLEEVFLKVGGDHSVTHGEHNNQVVGIGKDRAYNANLISQIIGITKRKLLYAMNDFVTIPLLALPIVTFICAAILYNLQVASKTQIVNDIAVTAIYIGGYLGAPGLIAEFLVRERNDKLRNVLTVMGCDFRAYWIGTFIADFILMSIPLFSWWITWGGASMDSFYSGKEGLAFLITILFTIQLIGFSYICSYFFTSPKACISFMPIFVIILLISPNIALLIVLKIANSVGGTISNSIQGGILFWGTALVSPHGAMLTGLLDCASNISDYVTSLPSVGAVIAIMVCESIFFLYVSYHIDSYSIVPIMPSIDPDFDPSVLDNLDDDVLAERNRAADITKEEVPLKISRLRKVFPSKQVGRSPVVATEDIAFTVNPGEIFGLLGANGAGKTTTLSMLTRALVPTSGDAFITKHSILKEFSKGATHLGVVTQNNSLWDRLSVEAHLFLFARLRGVPEDLVKQVVDGTIYQLELTPHRYKLAYQLSGGMKRKLCVAIALIGDPEVVLLDEPSAGLDPVSRRNLWSVILRTMSHRAVILTTHSMDEAEALCKRIGIMVHGQLRALGTKQHLKNKFGSGFELVVKLNVKNLVEQLNNLTTFVSFMFPSAVMISENGGLITYEIPKSEMKMGLAFSQLEANKQQLCIEDYSVAQPTLEQVFIRTVAKYDKKNIYNIASDEVAIPIQTTNTTTASRVEVVNEINKFGCTTPFTRLLTIISFLFFIGFWCIAAFAINNNIGGFILFIVAVICLIISIVGCLLWCCACCKPPVGADD